MKAHFYLAQSRLQKRLRLGLGYCLSLASVLAISAEVIAMPVATEATDQTQPAQTQNDQTQAAQAFTSETISTAAINPETRNPFVIRYVAPALNGVMGAVIQAVPVEATFKNPVGTIASAANIADTNADKIIFVQGCR